MHSAEIFPLSWILSLVATIKTQLDSGSLNLQKHYLGFNNQAMKLLFTVLTSWSEYSKGSIVFLSIFITHYFLILIKNIFWKCTVESFNPFQTLLLVKGWGQNKQLYKPFKKFVLTENYRGCRRKSELSNTFLCTATINRWIFKKQRLSLC